MSNYSTLLGLESETLQQLSETYNGYAAAMEEGEEQREYQEVQTEDRVDNQLMIGSCYAIAAIYQTIVEPSEAISLFGKAADSYRRENDPFWISLAICGFQSTHLQQIEGFQVDNNIAEEWFYSLLHRYYLHTLEPSRSMEILNERVLSYPGLLAHPVSSLQVPLGLYYALFRSTADENRSKDDARLWRNRLRTLLQRAYERLELLRTNTHGWNNITGPLPFEPDVLAVLQAIYLQGARNNEL